MNAPTFRAAFRPASINEDDRTVELVASTGAGVERHDFEGPFTERLEVSTAAVDLSGIDGMPLLDSHRQDGLDRVLGVVRAARIERGELIVQVEFSERAEAIWRDVKAGLIRNVSVGYSPKKWTDGTASGGRVRTVNSWTLMEVSLVPVGADPRAKTRSARMPDTETEAAAPPATTTPPPAETRAAINREIRALAQTFDLPADWSDDQIDRAATADQARAAALDALRQRRQQQPNLAPRVTVLTEHDSPEAFATRVGEALYATRCNPRHELSEPARPFAAMTTLDVAREALHRRGVSTTALTPADTVTRALHTTSDFPMIFADTANRVLREGYEAAPAVLKQVAKQTTARDFRAKTSIQLGEAPTLEKVGEHGEYKAGTMAEAKETYRIDTFGRIIGLTRKALINDDLGAFNDLAAKFGAAAADFEAQFLGDLLVANPVMDDGAALFHANHGNLAGTGAAISAETLSAARLAMRRQTGLSGRPIGVVPKYLIVPPELETTAEQILAAIQPATTDAVNPFAGKLTLLVEPRLTDTDRWYVAASPAQVPGLEYAYLQGAEGPQTESRAGFEVDGVEVKVRLDFGAAFLDWRSWYANPGA